MSRHWRSFVAGVVGSMCILAGQPGRCGQVNTSSAKAEQAHACQDSQGAFYSPGATLQVGGKTMQCVIGPHWVPAGAVVANAAADVLDIGNTNVSASDEAAILKALSGTSLPTLECDAVLNFDGGVAELTRVPPGERRLLMFWTPTCGPCKPLLADLAALAERKPRGLSVLGIVRSGDLELEPPGEWSLVRVKQLVAQYKVGFPTCVHSSEELMKRWKAEGVPLTIVLSENGVERVAAGGRNGQRLVAELSRR